MDKKIIIGSHVPFTKPDYLVGSLKFSIQNNANAFMIYLCSPQRIQNIDSNIFKYEEFLKLIKINNFSLDNIVIHAPYVLNPSSNDELARQNALFLINRDMSIMKKFNFKFFVLHPGSNLDHNFGIKNLANIINTSLKKIIPTNIVMCVEIMAGKGNEICTNFDEIKKLLSLIEHKNNFGVCLDTCHLNDAGYDVNGIDDILDQFNLLIGKKYLRVLHINDSKNTIGSHKDRHANIGCGTIGIDTLKKWVLSPRTNGIIKILETPYVDGQPIYKKEIAMLLNE